MKFPKHECGLYLEHNSHRDCYQTLEQYLEDEQYRRDEWISEEQFQKSLETGSVWVLTWYPDTPIGSYRYIAAELPALMEWVEKNFDCD